MKTRTKTNLIKVAIIGIMSFSALQYARAQEFGHQGFPQSFIKLTIYHWDGTSAWIEDGRMVPNSVNPPSEYVIEKKNGTQYDSAQRFMISYNSNGKAITEYDKAFNGTAWVYTNKDTFMYDGSGLETSAVKYDYSNGTWTNHRRYTFTYNTDGTEKSHLEESWGGSGWSNADQYAYSYTAGHFILITRQTWTSGAWATSYQYLPNYAAGVETNEIVQQMSGSNWVNSAKYEFTLSPTIPNAPDSLAVVPVKKKVGDGRLKLSWIDHANNENGFRIYRSTDGTSFAKTDSVIANVTTYTDTTLEASTQYYYKVLAYNAYGVSAFTNIVSSTTFATISDKFSNALDFGIFPNPASGNVILHLGTNYSQYGNMRLVLTSICGSAIKQIQITGAETAIETNSLAPGIYLYQIISSEGTLANGKLVIR